MNNPNDEIRRIAEEAATDVLVQQGSHEGATEIIQAAIHSGIRAWAQQEPSEAMLKAWFDAPRDDAADNVKCFGPAYRAMLNQAIEELEGKGCRSGG